MSFHFAAASFVCNKKADNLKSIGYLLLVYGIYQ